LRAEFEGHSLDDEEITTFVRSLLPAAADTTTRSFANLAVCLLSRPEVLAAVRQDRSLLPGAVNESLRYEGTLTVAARQASRDINLRGVAIPAGAGISLIVGSGNRDPDAFPDPDRFDIHRSGKPLLTFNLGPHMCLGIHVAKMELIEAMEALLDGLPNLRLDPDAPPPTIVGAHFRCPERVAVMWD
jgi:cytochrome P450